MIIQSRVMSRRRGVVAVFVITTMVVLLGFAALAIDTGYIASLTADQMTIADSGALAGASGLQDETWFDANQRAIRFIALNQEMQGYRSLEDQIIELGIFDVVSNTFTTVDDPTKAFAVRVRAVRNNVPLFFAGILGIHSTDVWREAVAIGTKPCSGVWGLNGIRVVGNVSTDSYDSTAGLYDAATAGSNGDICSGAGIRIMGSVLVDGEVMTGFGYEVDMRGASIITGVTTSTMTGGVESPPYDFGDVAYFNDNDTIGLTDGGSDPFQSGLNVSLQADDNLTLTGGTYYFESMDFSSGASLTLTGPTTIYLSGNFNATGSATINTTMNPADLTIITEGDIVKVTGAVSFYGSILAPLAQVSIGGTADFYGALVGGTVTMHGDFQIHVDESLPLAQPWFQPPPPFLVQ